MHRSNTSMLARMLANSGIPFGSDLVGAEDSNPYGHYEDVPLMELHEQILAENHSNWRPWFRSEFHLSSMNVEKAEKLVSERFEKFGGVWGFKVPHSTLLLPLWSRFPEARFMFVFRNPMDVYRSLLKRVGRQLYYKPYYPVNCMLTYVIYNRLIYDFYIENKSRVYLANNEHLLDRPSEIIKSASLKLGLDTSYPKENMVDKNIVSVKSNIIVENISKLMSNYSPAVEAYERLSNIADSQEIYS